MAYGGRLGWLYGQRYAAPQVAVWRTCAIALQPFATALMALSTFTSSSPSLSSLDADRANFFHSGPVKLGLASSKKAVHFRLRRSNSQRVISGPKRSGVRWGRPPRPPRLERERSWTVNRSRLSVHLFLMVLRSKSWRGRRCSSRAEEERCGPKTFIASRFPRSLGFG